MLGVRKANQPFDAEIRLSEVSAHNAQLPPLHDAAVTLTLDNEIKIDTIASLDAPISFSNIPHRFLGQPVHMTVSCKDYQDTDTIVVLSRDTQLNIQRDLSVYGNVRFKLWNINTEESVDSAMVSIEG